MPGLWKHAALYGELSNLSQINQEQPLQQPYDTCGFCGFTGHTMMACRKFKRLQNGTQPKPAVAANAEQTDCPHCGSPEHLLMHCPAFTQSLNPEMGYTEGTKQTRQKCGVCQTQGHTMEVGRKFNAMMQRFLFCTSCQTQGHHTSDWSPDCPEFHYLHP